MEETTTQSPSSCMCAGACACAEKKMCRSRCCGRKPFRIVALIIGFVFVLALFAWIDTSLHLSDASYAEKTMKNKVQAVFLSNGQVYFGSLSKSGLDAWLLTNVHYLEKTQVPGDSGRPETQTTLKKLTADMHQPEDAMFISEKNILFWQNLQNTSPIVQAIAGGK